MADPFWPIPEVRKMNHLHIVDNYGERWVVIDGVDTKVANLAAAKALLTKQDAVRVQIRADLDAQGIRDKTVQQEITLEDGTKTTVEMLPPGDAGANVLQFNMDPTPANIALAEQKRIKQEHVANVGTSTQKPTLWHKVKRFFRRKAR